MERLSVDEYFLQMADLVAQRSTCDRKHVGAVLVKDKRTVATGYNGSPAGMPHCDEVGHELRNVNGRDSCVRTLHAESNAIDHAGQQAKGSTLYCTATPCYECAKRIVNAGVYRLVVKEFYASQNSDLSLDLLKKALIVVEIRSTVNPVAL